MISGTYDFGRCVVDKCGLSGGVGTPLEACEWNPGEGGASMGMDGKNGICGVAKYGIGT